MVRADTRITVDTVRAATIPDENIVWMSVRIATSSDVAGKPRGSVTT
jgi:hypothetical protein